MRRPSVWFFGMLALGQSLACQGDPDDGPGVYDPISDPPLPKTALVDAAIGVFDPDDSEHVPPNPGAEPTVPVSPNPITGTMGGGAVGGGTTGGGPTGVPPNAGALPGGGGSMDAGIAVPTRDASTIPADAPDAAAVDAGLGEPDAQAIPDAG